jgi:hypothetical protein
MRILGSRHLTSALRVVVIGLTLLVLSVELSAAPGWAQCADDMAHTLILCDAGPGGWVIPATVLLAVALAFAAGVFFERARSGARAHDIRER